MMVIWAESLAYTYRTFKKGRGLWGTLRDFVSREYVEREALRGVSFEIGEGRIVGLLGPNGAGKTTLIKLLTGLMSPGSGEVRILGYEPHLKSGEFLRQIGVVLGQKSQLIWDLPPRDTFETLRVIYGVSRGEYEERLKRYSEMLNVAERLDTPARNLSLGERMKCEMIAALLHAPRVLFLDEPTIGLDIHSQRTIREFLKRMSKEFGVTILFTSHHLIDIEKLCDELYIIRDGLLCYQGGVHQLIDQCTPKVKIEFDTGSLKKSIDCEPSQLGQTLRRVTAEYAVKDLKVNKCSLEDAIYAILEH